MITVEQRSVSLLDQRAHFWKALRALWYEKRQESTNAKRPNCPFAIPLNLVLGLCEATGIEEPFMPKISCDHRCEVYLR